MTRYEIGGAMFIGSALFSVAASVFNAVKMRKMAKVIKKNNDELHAIYDRIKEISMDERVMNSEDMVYLHECNKEIVDLVYEGQIIIP